jgi:WD40 repeat protein
MIACQKIALRLFKNAALAFVLIASGGGLCYFALGRFQSNKAEIAERTGVIEARHHVGPMAFSPDGKTLALPKVAEGRVELWSLETGKSQVLVNSFNTDRAPARHVAFSNDGRLLAVYHSASGITLWDFLARKEQTHIPITRPYWLEEMTFAEGDQTLVTVLTRVSKEDVVGPGPDRWNHSAVRWRVSTGERQETY